MSAEQETKESQARETRVPMNHQRGCEFTKNDDWSRGGHSNPGSGRKGRHAESQLPGAVRFTGSWLGGFLSGAACFAFNREPAPSVVDLREGERDGREREPKLLSVGIEIE